MERLTKEAEDEFEFQDEKKRSEPRVFIPQPSIYVPDEITTGPPPFMTEFIVTKQKRQPVNVKLDSVIIKGSKILAYKAKSKYVEGSLWLMAKTFFYQEDWLNSQIKCSELIDKYTDGEFSPDAHLLYSKNLLIQRKYGAGELMLSRTVDIAWQKKRWDILAEALRIRAELALFQNDFEKALRPYRQAIAQSDDGQLKARWQLDMAALLFRIGKFDLAQKEFRKVHNFSPDYVQRFEAYLYEASSLARLGKYDESEKILNALYKDGKYEEWRSHTYAQILNIARLKNLDTNYQNSNLEIPDIQTLEKTGDSLYANSNPMIAYYFEKGVDFYQQNDYRKARQQFAKSRQKRTPAYSTSMKMFDLLNNWEIARNKIDNTMKMGLDSILTLNDSTRLVISETLYSLGRIHEELNNRDSVESYYMLASIITPIENPKSAQFLHNYARVISMKDPQKSDSLLDVIVHYHPLTDFGKDAQSKLGYTQNFVIDTVAELYGSGYNLMVYGDYKFARNQLYKIYENYPQSSFAPKSLYTLGWMFEKKTFQFDSALFYYNLLIEKYPQSDYAKDVNLAVIYKNLLVKGEEIPDSLKTKEIVVIPPKLPDKGINPPKFEPPRLDKNKENKSNINDPESIFRKGKELFQNPEELIKKLELPPNPFENPAEFFNLQENKLPDSTNVNQEPNLKENKK